MLEKHEALKFDVEVALGGILAVNFEAKFRRSQILTSTSRSNRIMLEEIKEN